MLLEIEHTLFLGDRSQVKYFGIGAFLQLLGCPVVSEIGLALFSKVLKLVTVHTGPNLRILSNKSFFNCFWPILMPNMSNFGFLESSS